MIRAMMIEPNASKPTDLPGHTYPPNEGVDKNNTYPTVPRIMNHHMVLDTLPHPPRSSITALRTFFRIAILAGSFTISTPSFSPAAELFPFAPPSSSQQRSVERQSEVKPQLSTEDKGEMRTFKHSWHIGNATIAKTLCETLKGNLERTVVPTEKLEADGSLSLVEGQPQ